MSDFLKTTLFERIERLQPDMQPEWGSMSPQHIVEHFIMAMALSSGDIELPLAVDEERLRKNYDYQFVQNRPLLHNIRMPFMPEKPGALSFGSIAEAAQTLRQSVERFYAYFEQNPEARPVHPAFGALSKADWERFHEKHFRHHLAQFGLGGD